MKIQLILYVFKLKTCPLKKKKNEEEEPKSLFPRISEPGISKEKDIKRVCEETKAYFEETEEKVIETSIFLAEK